MQPCIRELPVVRAAANFILLAYDVLIVALAAVVVYGVVS